MSGHWSDSYVRFLRTIIPELEVPLYVLRNDEHPIEWSPEWMACFSPLADLKAQPTLESLGLWNGRGVCVAVRNDFESWSTRCQCGTLLHEAAHAIEHLIQPDALAIELSPICREWLETGESKMLADAGIDRNDLIRSQHGADFVRLSMHLHQRARAEMHIVAADLQFLHGGYSLSPERYEDAVEALRHELAMSRNLNLLRLKDAPEAFARMFA
jgi:hypothetical protein